MEKEQINQHQRNALKPIAWVRDGECIRCTSHAINPTTGYVICKRGPKYGSLPRHILIRRHGPLPRSIVTRHTCDNKWCINPAHLIAGTYADNYHDCVSRGRWRIRIGAEHGSAKLSEKDALFIKRSALSAAELSNRFGVGKPTIYTIKNGTRWKHLA